MRVDGKGFRLERSPRTSRSAISSSFVLTGLPSRSSLLPSASAPSGLRRDNLRMSSERRLVGLTRFELVTPRLSSVCSNQLSYRPGDARSGAADSLKTGQACKCEPGEDQIDLSVPSAVALAWIVRPKLRALARRDL